ncbi:MAG: chemotaxis protein CheW [Clostridia bacterium]|nr:chemotaxis protein CheW [Clostridia bacterium]MCL6521188.1 chemotaxis protein CheW [Bacillota bacterium]
MSVPLDGSGHSTAEEAAAEQVVVLELDGQAYGAAIGSVREVLAFQPVTRVPQAPAFVLGVINLRGRIIPVIDLRRRLGLPAAEPGPLSRIVVVEDGEELVGMLVDGVSEVLDVPLALVEPPGELVRGEGVSFLRGVARLEERLVILLALERVLDAEEKSAAARAAHAGA